MSDASLPPEARTLVELAACGLLQTDAHGTIHWANRTFCNWVGRAEAELAGKVKIQDLFTVGGRIFHQTHWVPLMQMQHSVSEVKFDVVHANGAHIPMVLNGIRHLQGDVIVHELAAFVARDRDKYERELVRASKQLRELVAQSTRLEEAAKDRATFAEQMMGIVSHDLRNPLATVEMSAQILAAGALTSAERDALQRIERATQRASRMIRELLDFTQARLGKGIVVSTTTLDLHGVVAEGVEELAHAFPTRVLRHVRIGPGACVADADRLMQLVGNLVSNALAYGAADTPIVITSQSGEGMCAVSVHNLGQPIAPEYLERIFEPMTRGMHSVAGDERSVGLGLYIVREIAKAHGGRVSVSSEREVGTKFVVEFPVGAAAK